VSLVENLDSLKSESAFFKGACNVGVHHEVPRLVTKIPDDNAQVTTFHEAIFG
jgi:hypothetical protein